MVEDIEFLKAEIKKLNSQINKLSNVQKNNQIALDSYYSFFNCLFLDFDLKPKGILKETQELCQLLLDFISNVCIKHGLTWWLDYGNLLGVVRHKGFVPWDDDIDIGMTRADSLKFLDVIYDEIKYYGLEDIMYVVPQRVVSERNIVAFTQISVKKENGLYAGLDIFPIDFIVDSPENVKEEFFKAKCDYHINLLNGMDKKDVLDKFYNDYNLTYEFQNSFVPSIESFWGNTRKFVLFDSDVIFPLKKMEFMGKLYPCPNKPEKYLYHAYGKDFRDIPKNLILHKRLPHLKRKENVIENFNNFFEIFGEVNNKFSSELANSNPILFFADNMKKMLNINAELPNEFHIHFFFNKISSNNCRGYIQIGSNWNNSVFIGQISNDIFGLWVRKNGVTDFHNIDIPSNTLLDIEYSFKNNNHTLKIDGDSVVSVTESFEENNLLNINVEENSKITNLIIY